jgi:hypothetical protein
MKVQKRSESFLSFSLEKCVYLAEFRFHEIWIHGVYGSVQIAH